MRYVYLAALHEQVEPSLLLPQHLDGRLRHLRQGRLLVTALVQVVHQVVIVKQTWETAIEWNYDYEDDEEDVVVDRNSAIDPSETTYTGGFKPQATYPKTNEMK